MTAGGQKKRWAMVFSLFVAFVLCNLDKVNMSVAIVPMAESFGWTATQKGLVSSAFFWGYSFTQIPGGWLASKYGGKAVLFYGVMLWSLGTLIAPWCAALGMRRSSRLGSWSVSARASPRRRRPASWRRACRRANDPRR